MKFAPTFTTVLLAIGLAACGGGSMDDDAEPSHNQGFVVVDDATAPGPNANQSFVVVDDAKAPAPNAAQGVAVGKRHPRGETPSFVVVDD